MRALVTGAAGFIGSHLVERLRREGHDVRGVDRRTGTDLRTCDLEPLLDGVDVVFHLAGRPGVRASWGDAFHGYVDDNIVVTRRLLAAAAPRRFVYASSSSIYGDADRYPCTEEALPAPRSPYGVTKLAGEHLCGAYDGPSVVLRYFTVYGPRQRPDMAFHRMIDAALGRGAPFPLYGDGSHVRDYTYVDDVVAATIAAAGAAPGTTFNVAGGSSTTVSDALDLVGRLVGTPVPVDRRPEQAGDVRRTGASTERIRTALGWTPATDLEAGLARQVEWQMGRAAHARATADGAE